MNAEITRINTKIKSKGGWHNADIKCAIEKKGWTLSKLSIHLGFARPYLAQALHKKFPKGQQIIADLIGVNPQEIWPERYQDKKAKSQRIRKVS